jgi:Protein of unknown function (DUF2878)
MKESERRAHLRLLVAACIGSVLGFGAESVHQYAGVWELLGTERIPLWIAGVYAPCLFVAGLASMRFEKHRDLTVTSTRLAAEAGLFAAGFLAPVALHAHEWSLVAVCVAYLAGRWLWFREEGDWQVMLFVVAVDLVVEGGLVAADFYRYPNAHYAPLPLWLAPLWAGLAFSLRRFLRYLQA